MVLREWKARCPPEQSEKFIAYLLQTGAKETSETDGFRGMQILQREKNSDIEVTFLSYWENVECIKAFAGEDISVAKLYPEDEKYELKPDRHVTHYMVREQSWTNLAPDCG